MERKTKPTMSKLLLPFFSCMELFWLLITTRFLGVIQTFRLSIRLAPFDNTVLRAG